jgi:hypothetical protein
MLRDCETKFGPSRQKNTCEVVLAGYELPRKVDIRLPGKGSSNLHGARPVHQIISMIRWIQTSRLSVKTSLSLASFKICDPHQVLVRACRETERGGDVRERNAMELLRQRERERSGTTAKMAHIRQSKPDSGLSFQENVPETFQAVPSSLGSGWGGSK